MAFGLLLGACKKEDKPEVEETRPGQIAITDNQITTSGQVFAIGLSQEQGGQATLTTSSQTRLMLDMEPLSSPGYADTSFQVQEISAITGLPEGFSFVSGFRFGPSGFDMVNPMYLTFDLPSAPAGRLYGFHRTGGQVYLIPLYRETSTRYITGINHFSEVGILESDGREIGLRNNPSDADAFQHNVAAVFNNGQQDSEETRKATERELEKWREYLVIEGEKASKTLDKVISLIREHLMLLGNYQLIGEDRDEEVLAFVTALAYEAIGLAELDCLETEALCRDPYLKQGLSWIALYQKLGGEDAVEASDYCDGLLRKTVIAFLLNVSPTIHLNPGDSAEIPVQNIFNAVHDQVKNPDNEDLRIQFTSSDPEVASVRPKDSRSEVVGIVTAAGPGETNVRVSDPCDSVSESVHVVVSEALEANGIVAETCNHSEPVTGASETIQVSVNAQVRLVKDPEFGFVDYSFISVTGSVSGTYQACGDPAQCPAQDFNFPCSPQGCGSAVVRVVFNAERDQAFLQVNMTGNLDYCNSEVPLSW